MKKQVAAILTIALALGSLTACSEGNAEKHSDTQNSVTDIAAVNSAENKPSEKVTGIYGETEIPDIPCGLIEYEGKATILPEQDILKQSLESMIFETHTFGEYTVNLVGDCVRTDRTNFPDSIYTQKLRIEVEKNGTKIEGDGRYNRTVLYESQFCTEFRLLEEHIGNYLDVYELDNPVIAMRYFYDDDSARAVAKAVEFATIQNDQVCCGFVGISSKNTGVVLNPSTDESSTNTTSTILALNESDGVNCRVSVFAADEFEVVDGKTLVDKEAGIRYNFEFSDPPQMILYSTENIV